MAQAMSAKDILAMEEKEPFSPQSAKDILAMEELEEDTTSVSLPTINKDEKLKVNDIVANDAYVDKIRDYMVDRKGSNFFLWKKMNLSISLLVT